MLRLFLRLSIIIINCQVVIWSAVLSQQKISSQLWAWRRLRIAIAGDWWIDHIQESIWESEKIMKGTEWKTYRRKKVIKFLTSSHNIHKNFEHGRHRRSAGAHKKNKQNVKFFLDKVQCTWALQAKSEINLELYRHQRLFWNMANLWMFRTRKSNSSTLRGCRAALHEVGDLAIIGKDFSITILIKNEPKLEKLIGPLGNFSCLVLAWHVNQIWMFCGDLFLKC